MNNELKLAKEILSMRNYDMLSNMANIINKHESKQIIVTESAVDCPRMFVDEKYVTILCPSDEEKLYACEGAVANAIVNGTIFDDAERVTNTAEYIKSIAIPCKSIGNIRKYTPDVIGKVSTAIISPINNEGRVEICDADVTNGFKFIKDLSSISDYKDHNQINDIIDKYLGCEDSDSESLPKGIHKDVIQSIPSEIDSIKTVKPEDILTVESYTEVECDDPEDLIQEGFLSKRPKKLKPLPRDIIAYIIGELNNIHDSNSQAMIAGYTCSKLELVDFHLTCLDTNDDRYIVPHSRDYLVTMQKELNELLARILKVRPINRNDRVWRVNVTYPDGYQG